MISKYRLHKWHFEVNRWITYELLLSEMLQMRLFLLKRAAFVSLCGNSHGVLAFCLSLTPDTPTPRSECLVVRIHRGWSPVVWSDCMFFACITANAHVSSGWCQPQGISDLQLKAHRFPCGLCIDFTQYQEAKSGKKRKTLFVYILGFLTVLTK